MRPWLPSGRLLKLGFRRSGRCGVGDHREIRRVAGEMVCKQFEESSDSMRFESLVMGGHS